MPCAFHLDHYAIAGPGCQFGEDELVELPNGQTWCRFHLPMTVEGKKTPKAQWDEAAVDAFNDAIFAFIDAARAELRVVDLSGVVFPGGIAFERYRGEAVSLPYVKFIAARFASIAVFEDVHFGGGAVFTGARFAGGAGFEDVRFGSVTSFVGARFASVAGFEDVRFDGGASFAGARFGGGAGFTGASFGRLAEFAEVRFGGDARFAGASFAGPAEFARATFCGDADFSGDPTREGPAGRADTFPAFVRFPEATFNGRANFINRRFLYITDFRGATFEVAPEFHNSVLHQDTRFFETKFRDRKGTAEVDAASAYRTLKLAMETVRSRDEEARFYAHEQRSLRSRKDARWSFWLFSLLYEITSDYGRNFALPLIWLLVIFAVFFLFYLAAITGPAINWSDVWNALRFSLQQVFQPFEVFRVRADAPAEAVPEVLWAPPLWLAFLAAVQSLLTLSLLALFLLALRRRFKLD